jgi:hypothetical protein
LRGEPIGDHRAAAQVCPRVGIESCDNFVRQQEKERDGEREKEMESEREREMESEGVMVKSEGESERERGGNPGEQFVG